MIDDSLSWEGHIEHIAKKLASSNFALNSTKNFLPLKQRLTLYYSLFDSHLNYGNLLWGCGKAPNLKKVFNLQKKCVRNVAQKSFKAHTDPIFKSLEILKLDDKLSYCRAIFMHKYRHGKLPESFNGIFSDITCTEELQTRNNWYNYVNKPAVKKCLENYPYKKIVTNWNSLNIELKATGEMEEFESLLKSIFLSQYSLETDCPANCYSCAN